MDVSILGRIGYDLYADDHNVPLKDVTKFSRYLGGSSANMAVGLRRLGLRVGIIGCLGTDELSQYLVEYLQKEDVETRFVRLKAGYLPSFCLTEVSPPDHFPQVFYREKPADTEVEVADEERAFICQTQLFITNGTSLCASPSRESTYRAMEWAHRAAVKVAFDVDYRGMSWDSPAQAALHARLALPFVDILIANPEEICLVAETENVEEAIDRVREVGVPLVVAKLGSDGTRAITSEESLFFPSYPVKVLSTIGAGDGFASGFLCALVKGMPLGEALKYGNAAAAIVVNRLMCSEAMPRLPEVEDLIARHSEIKVQSFGPGS
ncbi:MAG: 5-dehydro-2-deoxygluconokinase [Acidobacteriota bacterium]